MLCIVVLHSQHDMAYCFTLQNSWFAVWHGRLASLRSTASKMSCVFRRLPAPGSTLDNLVRDRDWQRERAEACAAAGRASGGELPRAWHLAEQAFQAFVRAVGMLQVSPVLRISMVRASIHDSPAVSRPDRPDQ